MNKKKMNGGFILIESVVAWLILMITLLAAIKGFNIAGNLVMKGYEWREDSGKSKEAAEKGGSPWKQRKELLAFEMDGVTGSLPVVICEYGDKNNRDGTSLNMVMAADEMIGD